ncbi:MAG: alpha-hydroxy-acid oxidizing enzyme [Pseudomonadota bacterium]|jgi:L-lactate dehydrogenase (cytochrome)
MLTSIEDLRARACRRMPRMFYEYADSGSWTEATYRSNSADLNRILLRQRIGVNLEGRHVRSTLLGESVALPVALAPAGLVGMMHPDGEILAARAAEAFGVPFALSTMSICSIEDVAAATSRPFWFQLYIMRDRGFTASLMERAKAAGCPALIVTMDVPLLGRRHKDMKNGLTTPPRLRPSVMLNLATKLRWCSGMLTTQHRTFGNIIGHAPGVKDMRSLAEWSNLQVDPSFTLDDLAWVRERWSGKIILKGVLDPEDARRAADLGMDAIVVSNHGGRQLDGAPSSIAALPAVAEAVGHRTEVWMDSGVRSGQDILKALALGARGTMIGRAYIYGLGASGQAGVTRCLEILAEELELTMALCGRTSVDQIDRSILLPGNYPGSPPVPACAA